MDLPEAQLKLIFQKHKMEYVKKLGCGSYGTVYLVNSTTQQFLPLAVKCITKKQLLKRPSLKKYLSQQIDSMYTLKHPNIVKLISTFIDSQSIFLVMQYCEDGNLFAYQYAMPEKVLKINEALHVFGQIIKGLLAIHQENIIHRDLKCQNILLKRVPKNKQYICKIGDFGFAKQLSETAKSQCGTPNFMAPQVLSQKPYDKSVDVWSIAVILFYMLFGDYPFKGLNILHDIQSKCSEGYDLLRQININLIRKKNKSLGEKELKQLADFFKAVFVIDPQKRLRLMDVQQHFLLKSQKSQTNSQQTSQAAQELRWCVLKKMEFVQTVEQNIAVSKILTQQNQILLKYFVVKVCLWILCSSFRDVGFDSQESRMIFTAKNQKLAYDYQQCKQRLLNCITSKRPLAINLKLAHIEAPYDNFQLFKDIYRTFFGQVFAQIHASSLKQKQRLKIRVLCCHTINRVFQDSSAKYFSLYSSWSKNRNKQKKTKNCFDFQMFSRWIEEDANENIAKTISHINQYFYSKKP